MTSENYIPTGHEERSPRSYWTWGEMLAFNNGDGYNDLSGEIGSYPLSDRDEVVDRELRNIELLKIAAVNTPDSNGSVCAMNDDRFLSPEAREHNKEYSLATEKERKALGGLVSAIVVFGINPQQLHETLLTFDPRLNRTEI